MTCDYSPTVTIRPANQLISADLHYPNSLTLLTTMPLMAKVNTGYCLCSPLSKLIYYCNVSSSRCFWMCSLNAFIAVQLTQSCDKRFHLSTIRLLEVYFLCHVCYVSWSTYLNALFYCHCQIQKTNKSFINFIYSILYYFVNCRSFTSVQCRWTGHPRTRWNDGTAISISKYIGETAIDGTAIARTTERPIEQQC